MQLDEHASEDLKAVCLTLAQLDHYRSLGANPHDAAPVYAATDTAGILGDVLDAGAGHNDLSNTDIVPNRVDPIFGLTQIVTEVRVHLVPAGHVPSAAGFLFVLEDGDERWRILVNGDFSRS